jgi:hypothetical protein
MVAMAMLCGIRIGYTRLLSHFVNTNLAGGIEEVGKSTGRCSDGVVDLVQSTCLKGLVSEDAGQFKSYMMTIKDLAHWSLGACA